MAKKKPRKRKPTPAQIKAHWETIKHVWQPLLDEIRSLK